MAQQQTGSIAGTVVDLAFSVIPGAAVTLHGAATLLEARTNETGRFEFRELAPGSYSVEFVRLGFHKKTIQVQLQEGVRTEIPPVNLQIDVPPCGGQPGPPQTTSQPAYEPRIAGKTSQVKPGATITITRLGTRRRKSTTADAAGRFLFTAVPPGQYTLRARSKGRADFVIEFLEVRPATALEVLQTLELKPCPAKGPCTPTRQVPQFELCL